LEDINRIHETLRCAAQQFYLIIEADGLRRDCEGIFTVASSGSRLDPAVLSPWCPSPRRRRERFGFGRCHDIISTSNKGSDNGGISCICRLFRRKPGGTLDGNGWFVSILGNHTGQRRLA
jgi:hypothetical protein